MKSLSCNISLLVKCIFLIICTGAVAQINNYNNNSPSLLNEIKVSSTPNSAASGKVGGKDRFEDLRTLKIRVEGGGALAVRSVNNDKFLLIKDLTEIKFPNNELIEVLVYSTPEVILDKWTGYIEESVQLTNNIIVTLDSDREIAAHFVKRNTSGKKALIEHVKIEDIEFRTSENFIAVWDKTRDNNYYAKYILKWAEWARTRTIELGMQPPIGENMRYTTIYIHQPKADGLKGDDIFPDSWAQAVGTDSTGYPFYMAPLNRASKGKQIMLSDNFDMCCGSVLHETFHVMQHNGGRTSFKKHPVDDRGWYAEATATWFNLYSRSGPLRPLSDDQLKAFANAFPAFTMQPQLALWYRPKDKESTWSKFNHQYGVGLFFLYLTINDFVSLDFFPKSYYSKTSLKPMEYIYNNIPNLDIKFRDFAKHITVLEGFPEHINSALRKTIDDCHKKCGGKGNVREDGRVDDNTFAFDYIDRGSPGWVRPEHKNQGWSYSVSRLKTTLPAQISVSFEGDSYGGKKTKSRFHLEIIVESKGQKKFHTVDLSENAGNRILNLPADSIFYAVVVSTPEVFGGTEVFDYKINIEYKKIDL